MLVLGIDPGTRHLGWGLVSRDGTHVRHVANGVISPSVSLSLADRLVIIERGLVDVITEHHPSAAAVESLFFHKDPQAAAKLGHARGVTLLVLARAQIPTFEYAPAKVKRIVSGHGAADKQQVALMMRSLLCLSTLPRADATDALALAVTHLRLGPLADLGSPSIRLLAAKGAGSRARSERAALAKLARERGKR
jgi:crossover junction endodeoxyribonuclease RuvC